MAYTFKHGDRPLDGYIIQRAVGQGGFGEVYYAVSDGGREVALKYLRNNPEIELRGVTACMNLKSPHLVNIFDVKKGYDGEYFIVMEYVSGPSLRDLLIAEPNGLGVQKAAYFVREIAKGLAYLHERGIVHRDMKPGNIFYEDGYVKIGDYGLSKFISVSRHSVQTSSVGTVHYMAPEVGSGNYSRGIDVYALGVILYEMLLGKVPFEGSTMGEVLMKHLTARPEVDALPHPFAQVIRKALAKDPLDRYQNVEEMVAELMGVDDIRESVAGFNPVSLSGAVRHAIGPMSPVPSPNPPPGRYPRGSNPARHESSSNVLTVRLSQKARRIHDKVNRKMQRLGGRTRSSSPEPKKNPAEFHQRIVSSLIMAVCFVVGLGVVVGFAREHEVVGVSAFLMSTGLSLGVLGWAKLQRHITLHWHPQWAHKAIIAACCAPLLAIGASPMWSEPRYEDHATVLFLALLVSVLLIDWETRMDASARGEMSLGRAFSAGLCGLILCAIFSEGDDDILFIGGGIAAVASLVVEAVGWLTQRDEKETTLARRKNAKEKTPPAIPPAVVELAGIFEEPVPSAIPLDRFARPVSTPASNAAPPPVRPQRWLAARALWSVLAFAFFGGCVAMTVGAIVVRNLDPDERAGLVAGASACFSAMIFALRKTTVFKRPTFWRETLRPFLIFVAMSGIGGFTAAISMSLEARNDESFVAFVVGLILSSVLFLLMLFLRGKGWPTEAAAAEASSSSAPEPIGSSVMGIAVMSHSEK